MSADRGRSEDEVADQLIGRRRKWVAARGHDAAEAEERGLLHAEGVLNAVHRELDRSLAGGATFPGPRELGRRFAVLLAAVRDVRSMPATHRRGIDEAQIQDALHGLAAGAARHVSAGRMAANYEPELRLAADRLTEWLAAMEEVVGESEAVRRAIAEASPQTVTRERVARWREQLTADRQRLASRLQDAALKFDPAGWKDDRPHPAVAAWLELTGNKTAFDEERAAQLRALMESRGATPEATREIEAAVNDWATRHATAAATLEQAGQELHQGDFRTAVATLNGMKEAFADLDAGRLRGAAAQCEAEVASLTSLKPAAARKRAAELTAAHPLFVESSEYRRSLAGAVAATAESSDGYGGRWVAVAAALALAGVGAWWFLGDRSPTSPTVLPADSSQPVSESKPATKPAPAEPSPVVSQPPNVAGATTPPPLPPPVASDSAEAESIPATTAAEPAPLIDKAQIEAAMARIRAHEAAAAAGGSGVGSTAPDDGTAAARRLAVLNATRERPYVNTFGMVFLPVSGTRVLMARMETTSGIYHRVQGGEPHPISRTPEHPACAVSWQEAADFCRKLTVAEGVTHRLPSDAEWSLAAGLNEPAGQTPAALSGVSQGFPWGSGWPPKATSGNYSFTDDGFPYTAPVGTFAANAAGFHDMGGNVAEWALDAISPGNAARVLRGGAFDDLTTVRLMTSFRGSAAPASNQPRIGFRCVVELP